MNESQNDNKAAWYVVRLKDDAISAGPFDKRPGDSVLNQYQWYKPNDYTVEFGKVDEMFSKYDKFQEVKTGL